MEGSQILEAMKVQGLKDLETLVKNQVGVAYDVAIELAAEKLKAAIPGEIDDAIITMVVASLKPVLKEQILAQVEKISA